VLTEIKNRGNEDACIVVCDGLKGAPGIDRSDLAAGDRADLVSALWWCPESFRVSSASVGEPVQTDLRGPDADLCPPSVTGFELQAGVAL